MCGICGVISCEDPSMTESLVRRMCDAVNYRGPDDSGCLVLGPAKINGEQSWIGFGHRRLAIIDLSASGHQPMSNEDGTIWITYNGEIYNFKELRRELAEKGHLFKSHSDTEVIIHLYEEEGLDAVKKLNGMFAFALWDARLRRLWVCRDRAGIKPVVYHWNARDFIFASEIKAILQASFVPRALDGHALMLYLAFSYVPAPYTIFDGIYKLPPGHSLLLENGKIDVFKYWDVPQAKPDFGSMGELVGDDQPVRERLRFLVREAVRAQMVSDVPLGAFLSGGIDSSVIVAFMAEFADRPVKTFTIGYKDDGLFDETRYAREVAGKWNTDHREIMLSYRDMLDVLPEVLNTFDEPFSDSSAIPTFIVSRETKKAVSVALSGDGGDELFAGYRSHLIEYWYGRYMSLPTILRKGLIEKIVNRMPESRETRLLEYFRRIKKFVRGTRGDFTERMLSRMEIFPLDLRKRLLSRLPEEERDRDPARQIIKHSLAFYHGDPINKTLYLDFKDALSGDMLNKVDWMSMRNSLEVRVPLLDHRLVELAFAINGREKLRNGKTKIFFREAFKDKLPRNIYTRPKSGFEVPISRWLRNELKFLVDQHLSTDLIRKQGLFDADTVADLARAHMSGKADTSWMLWNLIVFQHWHANFLA